ncbi:DUF3106 domain-containing protein [Parvibium lacunae]|uniref:DUF3106 domain-containing protein n=1 Tax=Parvibium lacunae TaxID=1888893 RepID=UPI0013140B1F|nr:DUF3106 domain-containing protein [Parvibium lacunae]
MSSLKNSPPAPPPAGPHLLSAPLAPEWKNLTPAQQSVLAPLREDWPKMVNARKLKWLEIANRYPKMSPLEQQRLQDRMREWARLTPEQRQAVRESFSAARKLPADKKQEKWQNYQQLADEEKIRLQSASSAPVRLQRLAPGLHAQINAGSHRPVIASKPLAAGSR